VLRPSRPANTQVNRANVSVSDQLIGSHVAFSPSLDGYLGEILANALNFSKRTVLSAPGEEKRGNYRHRPVARRANVGEPRAALLVGISRP
jgi:hypothetical protein